MAEDNNKPSWFDEARHIDWLYYALIALCVALFVADFFAHRHAHYDLEGLYGFYALFGFIAYALIVGAGWIWRRVVLRKEDYYDD